MVAALRRALAAACGLAACGLVVQASQLPSAAQAMQELLTDLSTAHGIQPALRDAGGKAMRQVHLAGMMATQNGKYVAAGVEAGGVRLYQSADLVAWRPAGLLPAANAAAPSLFDMGGRYGPPLPRAAEDRWWVLAYESAGQVKVALFTSSESLLAGNAARVFAAPILPLLPAGSRAATVPASYGSPTVYTAVYSQRGGRTTVDVVMSVSWTDSDGISHPASAMLAALSPDSAEAPDYNVQFGFDGIGYDGSGAQSAGPLRWEMSMRKAVQNFSYTGSSMAVVPCGPGCGDPRDRAGGNAGGTPGGQKISLISGVDGAGKARLLLWGW